MFRISVSILLFKADFFCISDLSYLYISLWFCLAIIIAGLVVKRAFLTKGNCSTHYICVPTCVMCKEWEKQLSILYFVSRYGKLEENKPTWISFNVQFFQV